MKKTYLLALAVLGLTAWADDHQPAIDLKGKDKAVYQQDLKECREVAKSQDVGHDAAVGAGIGAGLGAATGAIWGGGSGAGLGAASGTVNGGADAGLSASAKQDQIVDNCLRNRGYNVLN